MKLTQPIFWLLTLLWFAGAALWWYSCNECAACEKPPLPGPEPFARLTNPPGLFAADSNWQMNNSDNLRFAKSSDVPVTSSSVDRSLDSLSAYLKTGKTVTVTGFYNLQETNNTSFENLGLARADAIKKILVTHGAPDNTVLTASKSTNDLYISPADTIIGGAAFNFMPAEIPSPTANNNQAGLFEPYTVYFNTAENTLNTTAELENYIIKAKKYLTDNAGKKLLVSGHTDNVGDAAMNRELSAARAAFVKAELLKKGFTADQIVTSGKGPDEPAADNNTAEGRAKNRRVTINLQQ